GAIWPDGVDDVKVKDPREHWAFKKPMRPPLPSVQKKEWPRNEIDYFILARLEKEKLAPSREAEKAVLLRRVSLDLIGLPPSVEEVEAFEKDASADAYEKAVDRLLASPHYGERWARPWLDCARYGDTHGYEKDPPRTMWPWRDWVIKALNDNMPFDQFTIEQIAGDLLPNATLEQKVATGFHRNSLLNDEGGTDPEEFRWAALNDRVEVTATVWLGLTMNCAQCHSHKFDPISQTEYYQFLAFFNNTEDGGKAADPVLPVPQAGQDAAKAPKTMIMKERAQARETHVAIRGSYHAPGDKVSPNVPAIFPPLSNSAAKDGGGPSLPNRLALAKWLVDENNPLTARVTMNRDWGLFFGTPLVETVEDFGTRGDVPSHPELLDWLATEFMRAKWDMKAMHKKIVMSAAYRQSSVATPLLIERDPYNRLLARGARFRVEAEMVRDIALTASGRLNEKIGGPSVFPPQPPGIWENSFGFQSFAGNQSNWKTAEDGDRFRRGMYIYWRRTAPYPSLQTFDLVSRDVCKVKRSRTNTPLQALTLLNDPVYVECAGGLAQKMMEFNGTDEAKIAYGLRRCVSRVPKASEIEKLAALRADAVKTYDQDAKAAETLLVQARVKADAANAKALATWIVVANVMLNLDETVTKN
ncbi:MAG TPA: DUF1549 and DUF1553 domain-containing protein, partial [Planctomycetota bacterium]|nr:DUF1549 and DUF1553 domain-containing protein [Planctomycetota bacterium]